MITKPLLVFGCVIAACLAICPARAVVEDPPAAGPAIGLEIGEECRTPQEVIARNLAALGGEERLRSVRTLVIGGSVGSALLTGGEEEDQPHPRTASESTAPGSRWRGVCMPQIKETLEGKKKRAKKIIAGLRRLYPNAGTALSHRDPFQLLIATILSAQSTDETVNKVTPVLFKRYKTARALARAPRETIEEWSVTSRYRQASPMPMIPMG